MRTKIHSIIYVFLLLTFPVFAQDFKQVADGIEYAEMMRGTEKEPIRLNLLRLDLTKVRLDVVHALDAAVGLETTSSIAKRHGAIAAINAGFFKMEGLYKGDAAGVLQIDGKLLSESFGNRIVLVLDNKPNKTDAFFIHLSLSGTFTIKTKKERKIFNNVGLNRQRNNDDLLIFTPEFHRTTLTNSNGLEIVVQDNKITQIIDGKGSNLIPSNGFVVSATGKKRDELLPLLKVGHQAGWFGGSVDLNKLEGVSPKIDRFSYVEDIVGGVPQLIKNGKIEITWQEEKIGQDFVETKHPRTAVAKLKDGKFLMVTVDGRQPEHSIGINLNDLAALLLELGATDAMNLDGGGSTTMVLNGEIKNKPSDKTGERSVSDAILVFPRKKQ